MVKENRGDRVVGHISRDSTAINSHEKPEPKPKEDKTPKKRGRPKKGEICPKKKTRLQKQTNDMTLEEMREDLLTAPKNLILSGKKQLG